MARNSNYIKYSFLSFKVFNQNKNLLDPYRVKYDCNQHCFEYVLGGDDIYGCGRLFTAYLCITINYLSYYHRKKPFQTVA